MAELFGCTKVNEIMGQILSTLQEYEKETDNMVNAEIEILQEALIARNELIDTLEDLKEELQSIVECEAPEEQALLKALINGSFVNVELDELHKRLQMIQRNITATKQRIVDKDKVISGQSKNGEPKPVKMIVPPAGRQGERVFVIDQFRGGKVVL